MIDVATFLTTTGGVATIFAAKELWSVIKARMSNGNGNGKKEQASVQVNVEPSKHDSTSGKRICDFHMPLMQDSIEMKRDIKDLNGKCTKMDKEIGDITVSQSNTHRKLDIILDHYGLSEWGRKNP